MSGTAAYQGRSQFEKVISIAQKARKIDPASYMALLYLGDDLIRLKRYKEAKIILEEAISIYPDNFQFHEMMVDLLRETQQPLEDAIPHIKQYFKNTPSGKHEFPAWVKLIFKVFKPNFDSDAYSQYLDTCNTSWGGRAKNILMQCAKEDNHGPVNNPETIH